MGSSSLIDSSLTVVGLAGYHLPEPEPDSGAAGEHKPLYEQVG